MSVGTNKYNTLLRIFECSNSWLKYASSTDDYVHECDTDFYFPPKSGEHCGDGGSDSCFDNWWGFPVLDFSFFSIKRRKHYKQLNQYVFKPLSNLELTRSGSSYDFVIDDFKFELRNLPSESSRIYRIAMSHMNHDNAQLPTKIES